MKLSEIKTHLASADSVNFVLPNGEYVPSHFHVTEIGLVRKDFIDCGGQVRNETAVTLQLLSANDVDHRLKPQKLLNIIALSERKLGISDHEVEVEYQGETIGKYGLEFNGSEFELVPKQTACLASDRCGMPKDAEIHHFDKQLVMAETSCKPGGGCC